MNSDDEAALKKKKKEEREAAEKARDSKFKPGETPMMRAVPLSSLSPLIFTKIYEIIENYLKF